MLTCARCGNEEPEGSGFCGSCGAPFVPADPQPAHMASMEASTPTGVMAPASTDAPTEVAPPPVWPQTSPSDPAPPRPAAAAPPARGPRRVWPFVLIAPLLLLFAAGAAAVLFGSGVIGGKSGKSRSAFVLQVNENVLGPLGQADETAAEHTSTTDGAFARAADGGRIVRVADEASGYLRALSGMSRQQRGQAQLLLALVAANRRYGQAFAAFTPADNQGQVALDRAAAAARAAIATAESGLSADLHLPSQTAFISLPSTSLPPPSSTTSATPPASAPPPSTTTNGNGDATAAQDAVYTYWSYLQLGEYRAAFGVLSPSEQQSLGGIGKWLRYYAGDPVESVNVNLEPATVSRDTAYVSIASLETVGAATGCRDWTGTYRLVRRGSGWLIDYAKLTPTNC